MEATQKPDPCPDEQTWTISAEAGLVQSIDEGNSSSNEGRILLFPDRLVFVAKDRTGTPIIFKTLQKILVTKPWLMIPGALELTDFSGRIHYLVVEMSYYWKNKIKL